MRFKVDENLPVEVVEELARAGHEADTVAGEGLAGADDVAIAAVLQRETRALITFDLDFANLRRY